MRCEVHLARLFRHRGARRSFLSAEWKKVELGPMEESSWLQPRTQFL